MWRNNKLLIYAVILVVVNVLIGHFLPPSGIMLSPIVIVLITVFVLNLEVRVLVKSLVIGGLISLQDIGVKLFSGGTHDYEGLGWIHFMLLMGVTPSFLAIVYFFAIDKDESVYKKIFSALIFILLLVFHLSLFSELGVN